MFAAASHDKWIKKFVLPKKNSAQTKDIVLNFVKQNNYRMVYEGLVTGNCYNCNGNGCDCCDWYSDPCRWFVSHDECIDELIDEFYWNDTLHYDSVDFNEQVYRETHPANKILTKSKERSDGSTLDYYHPSVLLNGITYKDKSNIIPIKFSLCFRLIDVNKVEPSIKRINNCTQDCRDWCELCFPLDSLIDDEFVDESFWDATLYCE